MRYTKSTLTKLEDFIQEIGFKVRYEKGQFQSGSCLIRESKIIVVNKFLNIESRIRKIIEILSLLSNDELIMNPAIDRKMQRWSKMIENNVNTIEK